MNAAVHELADQPPLALRKHQPRGVRVRLMRSSKQNARAPFCPIFECKADHRCWKGKITPTINAEKASSCVIVAL